MTEEAIILLLLNMVKHMGLGDSSSSQFFLPDETWLQLLDCAQTQNIAPLLYFYIKKIEAKKALPAQVLQRLQLSYHQNTARNLRLYHELNTVLGRLSGFQIPVIVLKGAFLASSVYSSPSLRSMTDIDILLHARDIPAALECLKALGYINEIPPWVNSTEYHIVLTAPDGMTRLEVHWDLAAPNKYHNIPLEEIWASAVPVEISGSRALALSPEMLLLYLCQHMAMKHQFMQGIRPLIDIDRTIAYYKNSLDWQKIMSLSTSWGLQRAVALTLLLCHQHLDTPIPDSVIAGMQLNAINSEIVKSAFVQISTPLVPTDALTPSLAQLQAERKLTAKFGIFLKYVFLLPDIPYQTPDRRSKLVIIYYTFRRIIYLIEQYGASIWRRIWGRSAGAEYSGQEHILLRWLQA